MFKLSILLALAILGSCSALPVEDDVKWDWRIVGGQNAHEEQFPYQVSLRGSSNNHFCGGIILSERAILTAAHCVRGRPLSNCVIHAGTHLLSQNGKVYQTKNIVIHPEYDSFFIENDIALVFTTEDIVFDAVVQPVELEDEYVEGGKTVVLSGWGTTSFPGDLPNNLQYISLLTLDYEECRSRLNNVNPVFHSQICTYTKRGEGACHGDSGGPLVLDNKLVGIVSWGSPCALGYPDVFSRISFFTDWIEENLEINRK